MRIWEVDDLKTIPADMVREQDFIMRVRRMHRAGETRLILNLVFDAVDQIRADRALKEKLQQQVADKAKELHGESHLMANGDAFVVLPLTNSAQKAALTHDIVAAALPADHLKEDSERILRSFTMPADYTPLRERTNHYIDAARAASTISASAVSPQQALQGELVRGPLTAWSLNHIERLLGEIDIHRYVRTQPIYEHHKDGKWQPLAAEYFVSVEDLKNERFPRLNIRTPERLFMELCCTLDRRLLQKLTENIEVWAGQPVHINLSVETILSATFAQFCHVLPAARRALVTFEINRADLLLDFSMTQNAIHALHHEGFRVCLDSLHPEMLPFLNIGRFNADFYKIRVTKDQLEHFSKPEVLSALHQVPADRVIFFRCDNETALELGQKLGISKYQGWLIDDVVHHRHQ
jgi:EAL domain-containing protein (putative c-di-GMP-specific phosphodiesterase class I)